MENDTTGIEGPFDVHLVDGTVLNCRPHTMEELRPVYRVLGDADARVKLPINDGSLAMLATKHINYILWRPTQKEA